MSGASFVIIQDMKFYIAARASKKSEVKKIHNILVDGKHQVLSTWVNAGQLKPYNKHSNKVKTLAIESINAVRNSDVFILISDKTGAGMYTELGIAIDSNLLKGIPKIYIIGEYSNRCVFFFHPVVICKKNIKEVLKDI